jgi:hypothetical protein
MIDGIEFRMCEVLRTVILDQSLACKFIQHRSFFISNSHRSFPFDLLSTKFISYESYGRYDSQSTYYFHPAIVECYSLRPI